MKGSPGTVEFDAVVVGNRTAILIASAQERLRPPPGETEGELS